MKQARRDDVFLEAVLSQNFGYADRMDDVRGIVSPFAPVLRALGLRTRVL